MNEKEQHLPEDCQGGAEDDGVDEGGVRGQGHSWGAVVLTQASIDS